MYEKIIVVTRKTRLDELIERFNTRNQAKFYIEHAGGHFQEYQDEHDAYIQSVEMIRKAVDVGLKVQFMDRHFLPSATITNKDIIVTIGQDGVVANTAKYAGIQPIIAVNPDPLRIDGVLCQIPVSGVHHLLSNTLSNQVKMKNVTLAKVRLNDAQELIAFNDFFIGVKTHTSSRYKIKFKNKNECQSSSGIIISTGAGSTGWLSSLINMGSAITEFSGGSKGKSLHLKWEEERLTFIVREPFMSRSSSIKITAGFIDKKNILEIESHNASNGIIFSDGIENDFLEFNAGSIAKISVADQQAKLVVFN